MQHGQPRQRRSTVGSDSGAAAAVTAAAQRRRRSGSGGAARSVPKAARCGRPGNSVATAVQRWRISGAHTNFFAWHAKNFSLLQQKPNAETSGLRFGPIKNDRNNWRQVAKHQNQVKGFGISQDEDFTAAHHTHSSPHFLCTAIACHRKSKRSSL